MNKDIKKIAEHFRADTQLDKLREEALELVEAIDECYLPIGYPNEHLLEELADTRLMIKQVNYLIGSEKLVDKIEKQKIARTLERIKTGYYEGKANDSSHVSDAP